MTAERPWLAEYPSNVPAEIDLEQYRNIVAVLEDSCEKYRDKPAFENMGKLISYDELDRLSYQFACYLLLELKLKKGDRVAIMMPNLLQYPVAIFGVLRAGLTVVNTNPLYTARELKHQLNDSGAVAIVVVENFANVVQEVIAETGVKHVFTTTVGGMLGFPKRQLGSSSTSRKRCRISACRARSASPMRWPTVPAASCPRSTSRPRISPSCSTPAAPPACPRARC
jgi:long-chain acyl-CoA synthetase